MLNSRHRNCRQQAFTIVEMMVTILILAILAAFAAPSFHSFVAGAEVQGTAESIFQGLQIARTEAVRQNLPAHFTLAANTSWSVVAETQPTTTIQSKAAAELSRGVTLALAPVGTATVTFNGMGRVMAANTDASSPVTTIDVTAPGAIKARRIIISTGAGTTAGGQLALCDPSLPIGGSDPKACPL